MGEMSGRSKIVIGVIVAVVIMCAIIIPITVVVNNQRQVIESTKATVATTVPTTRPTTPTPTTQVFTNPDTCPNVQASQRFDCFPDTSKQNKNQCEARGCCWVPTNVVNAPNCFFPPNYPAFTAAEQNVTYGKKFILTRNQGLPAHYGSPINSINLEIQYQTENRLRVKVSNIIFYLLFSFQFYYLLFEFEVENGVKPNCISNQFDFIISNDGNHSNDMPENLA